MTRRHFAAIAEAVRFLELTRANRLQVAEALADVCRRFNSRFDRGRFLEAAMEPTAADTRRAAS